MIAYNYKNALPAGHPPPFSNYTVQQHPAPYGDHLHTNKEPVVAPPPILRQSSIANFRHTITQSCDNQCTKDSDYHQQPDPVNSDPDELPEPGYVPIRRTKQANVILPPLLLLHAVVKGGQRKGTGLKLPSLEMIMTPRL